MNQAGPAMRTGGMEIGLRRVSHLFEQMLRCRRRVNHKRSNASKDLEKLGKEFNVKDWKMDLLC